MNLAVDSGENGGVVLKCHSHGCDATAVTEAVGLTVRDLMPESARTNGAANGRRVVKRYRYNDARGELVFEVWRYEPKDFRPHYLNSQGEWASGDPPGVPLPLYRLPELLAADPKQPVFICAGEKDADNLAHWGLVATTNPHGESPKWERRTQWLEPLKGRRCIILEDYDALNPKLGVRPGEKHAKEVFAALTNAGIEAKRLLLPGLAEGQDVSDWLTAGHAAVELLQLSAPEPPRMALKFLTREALLAQPDPVWQIENFIYEESFVEIFGPTNQGKTFFAVDLALSLVRGGAWRGSPILKPGPVVYINGDGGRKFKDRIAAWEEAFGPDAAFEFITYPDSLSLHQPGDVRELIAALAWLDEPPVAIFFDTLSRCIAGANENLQEPMTLVVDALTRIKIQFGASPIVIHHTDKSGQHDRGSSVVGNAADTIMRVDMNEDELITVACEKQRDWQKFTPLCFRFAKAETVDSGFLKRIDFEPGTARQSIAREGRAQFVLDLLRSAGRGLSQEEIVAMTPGYSRASVSRYLKSLEQEGVVLVDLSGTHAYPKRPALYYARPGAE